MAIDLAALRQWTGIAATSVDDEALSQVVAAEEAIQRRLCRIPVDAGGAEAPGPDLVQAIYRRVARHVAAKGVPLGMMGEASEFGPARLARFDGEIDRLEGPSRIFIFG